jgi:hypothetical protein
VRREDPGQRGAAILLVAGATLALSVIALGGATIARLAVVRADVQRAADAAALAALEIVRTRGLPFDADARRAAERIAARNAGLELAFDWRIREGATEIELEVVATAEADTPLLVFADDAAEVEGRAVAGLGQASFTDATRRQPKLALVLDYSGSMSLPFTGSTARAVDVLEDSVAALLDADLAIDYGAVAYGTDVRRAVPVDRSAPDGIRALLDDLDVDGVTNTAAALGRARELLLAAPDTGRYVLLVSDGEPCCQPDSFARARAAADGLWQAGITTFTLEIRRQGSTDALDQFMTDVAGTPGAHASRDHHFVATSASDLVDEFEQIAASIACSVGPLVPPPSDPDELRLFLAEGTSERPLPATDDLGRDAAVERYKLDPGDATIRLTEAACDAVIDRRARVVVRDARPGLRE